MTRTARSRRAPVYRDTGFPFQSIDQSAEAFAAEAAFPQSGEPIYTRYSNPTVLEAEDSVAQLEGSDWAMLAASGMAAIDIALSPFHVVDDARPWLFFSELYGGTNAYIREVLIRRRGIPIERFFPDGDRWDMDRLAGVLDRVRPALVYFEAVSNPLLMVADGRKIIELAQARGAKVLIDNTFATPALWKPLEDGADVVIHSATKYFGGHGDLTAGAVCGNDADLHSQMLTYRKLVGHIFSPDDAYRLTTQMKTFSLRFKTQCENAEKIARLLEDHPKVSRVLYPGLDSHPTHAESAALFGQNGWGAMITFELAGGREAAVKLVEAIQEHIAYVLTLGDSETIILHVPTTFGADRYPNPGMMRLSVGFEPYAQIEAAMLGGLAAV
jgi:cystathionine beta-lyase/cystathionine gamma-synthase